MLGAFRRHGRAYRGHPRGAVAKTLQVVLGITAIGELRYASRAGAAPVTELEKGVAGTNDPFSLQRFVTAQASMFETALAELRVGCSLEAG
jgi:hypothetical protein